MFGKLQGFFLQTSLGDEPLYEHAFNVQAALHCATNMKLILGHFCLPGRAEQPFIILFTICSEAPLPPCSLPMPPPCTKHTTHRTRGCSSLMKEKITHRQPGSHTIRCLPYIVPFLPPNTSQDVTDIM